MKFRTEYVDIGGEVSVNFRTNTRTIKGREVGVKLQIIGKCPSCKKPRSITERYTGYVENGFNTMSAYEAMEKYKENVDEVIKRLESGESTRTCGLCGSVLV